MALWEELICINLAPNIQTYGKPFLQNTAQHICFFFTIPVREGILRISMAGTKCAYVWVKPAEIRCCTDLRRQDSEFWPSDLWPPLPYKRIKLKGDTDFYN